MSSVDLSLLGRRRFLPLFATQCLGAFNDNLYRSAMLFLVSFTLYRTAPDRAALVAVIAGGVFILPYFLFSSLAGEIADRIDKARVAQAVKLAEIAIMAAGVAALGGGSLPLLMAVLFAMGVHSTLFGPVKYSMLPQHLGADELMGGTGLVEAGTFVAILAGQFAGGLLATRDAGFAMIAVAVAGLAASLFILPAPPPDRRPTIDVNLARSTGRILAHAARDRPLFLVILGITWFFALGAVLMQQFVALVGTLHATQAVGALFLGLFSIGVAGGSLLVGRLLRGAISPRFVPVAALLLALGTLDLGWTVHGMARAPTPVGVTAFLTLPGSWHLVADLVAIAIAGGVYIVPLYALLQTLGDPAARSRDVAANNIVNAAGMVLISGLAAAVLATGAGSAILFVTLGMIGLAVTLATAPFLPETPLKARLRTLLGFA